MLNTSGASSLTAYRTFGIFTCSNKELYKNGARLKVMFLYYECFSFFCFIVALTTIGVSLEVMFYTRVRSCAHRIRQNFVAPFYIRITNFSVF